VLVVAHQQHVVGNLRIGDVRPAVVVEGNGEHHDETVRGERARQFAEKVLQVLLRLGRDLLEIDGQSLKLVGLEKGDDLVDARRTRRRIRKQPREAGSVPFALNRILDHGKDRRVGLRFLDQLQHPIIDIGLQLEV
jgi:hypothetical protein